MSSEDPRSSTHRFRRAGATVAIFAASTAISLAIGAQVAQASPAGHQPAALLAAPGDPQPPMMTCTPEEARATQRWWRFGNSAGIDFGTSGATATAITGAGSTEEGSTVVTDVNGDLQFWSNGQTIYNRDDQPMPNGSGLLGNASATQTVAAFRLQNQPGKYVVVANGTNTGAGPTGSLTYSVVDLSLDGGLGDVVSGQKNLPLGAADTASEALIAVPNADGTGFWVYTFTNNSPNVIGYEFDGNGYTGNAVTSVLSGDNHDGYGSLALSPDGTMLVQQTGVRGVDSSTPEAATLRLLIVDAESGQLTEKFAWAGATDNGMAGYTADFSPAGNYVYFSRIFGGGELYRYAIEGAASAAEIKASEQVVGSTGVQGGRIARGPDGRMYVANQTATALNVVNAPNSADPAYVQGGFPLAAGTTSSYGLPDMVTACASIPDAGAPMASGEALAVVGGATVLVLGIGLLTRRRRESAATPA